MKLLNHRNPVLCFATLCVWYGSAFAWNGSAAQPPPQPAPASPTAAAQPAPPAGDKPPIKQEELDQMLAPIALYPDALLSQVLMASTYPVEIVSADRWVKANKSLKGEALAKELESQDWDPSVKSLVNFPDVLSGLSEKLDQTVKIGDAFLADQKQVMETIQSLRARADKAGNLKSSDQVNVTVEAATAAAPQVIVIESKSPEVIYVPSYNPTVVYGTWPYPSYPPYPSYYYPPGYVATAAVSFGVGLAVGAAWGYAWGGCNWRGGDVDIDINRNTNINNNINRNKYQNNMGGGRGQGSWQHDSSHRKGASYRDSATSNRYGGSSNRQAAQSREAYRGRADAGRQDLSRGGASATNRSGAGTGARPSTGAAGSGNRPSTGATNRATPSTSNRSSPSKSSAFQGSSGSGSSTRAASSRGSSSRSSGASRGGGGSRGGGRR